MSIYNYGHNHYHDRYEHSLPIPPPSESRKEQQPRPLHRCYSLPTSVPRPIHRQRVVTIGEIYGRAHQSRRSAALVAAAVAMQTAIARVKTMVTNGERSVTLRQPVPERRVTDPKQGDSDKEHTHYGQKSLYLFLQT